MALSQEAMNNLGQHAVAMHGELMELITVEQRSNASVTPTTHGEILSRWRHYSLRQQTFDLIAPEDMECRILVVHVFWVPSTFDRFMRADGSKWQVKRPYDGPGHAWWKFQMQRVG